MTGSLEVALNASSTTFTFATLPAGTPASPRTVVVTSTAVGTAPGESSVSDQATITLGASPTTPPTIVSWHKL